MTPDRWAQVKEVFQAAIERQEDEREEFVAGACVADEDLRREVESLLREHSHSDPLTSPVREIDLSGRTVTHFKVIEKLGRGGMGVVYRAEDLKLGRMVALKFLAPHMPVDEEQRSRFVREARALAAISHPHICAVHEIDEADGRLFLAMAFIDGPTLKERIADGPLEMDEALRIVTEAARGLQAAHRTGVIHRDVKSANIMLDAEGRAIITDFGLALLENQPGLSQAGLPMGTPGYMSPEQSRGERGDRRSDIWSLGIVLYEMVSGRLPFPAVRGPVPEFSDVPASLTTLRPGIPPALDRVVRKALAKAPDARYQSAEEMAADLRSLLAPAPEKRGRTRLARLFTKWRLAAAVGLILLAVAGAALWRTRSIVSSGPHEAARLPGRTLPEPRASEAFLRAYHLTHKWRKDEILKGREYFLKAIAEDPNYASAYVGLADSYMSEGFSWGVSPVGLLPKAEAAVAQAIRLDSGLASAYIVQGMLQGVYRRNWAESERLFRRARQLDGGRTSWVYAAYFLAPLGRLDEALEIIERSQQAAPLSLNVNVWVGWIRLYRREEGEAEKQFRKTLELEPGFEYARTGLVGALAAQHRFQEALAVRSEPRHIEHNAWIWVQTGRRAEARAVQSQLIERSKREYVGGYELAWLHAALGDTDLAFQQLEKAYRNHEPALAHVNVDPKIDSLRPDPRFRELLRKMNLTR